MVEAPRVIVGAGLAGSAVAVWLARGRTAGDLLLERTASVRPRICGEFISAEAATMLADLGVDPMALGGRPTRRLRLAHGKDLIEAELPFTAVGLTRRALDSALQRRAQAVGVQLLLGQRVTMRRIADAREPYVLTRNGADPICTRTLLLATGKSDIPLLARRPLRDPEPLVGLRLHLRLAPAQARAVEGHVEVMLTADGYAGLQPVEDGKVNLCLLLQQGTAGARPDDLLRRLRDGSALLRERLEGSRAVDEMPESIYRVPYGFLHRSSIEDPPGLWRLGDQAAVIASFTGDGMAIALHSAAAAARTMLAGGTASDYHRRLRTDLQAQIARARWLYRLGRWAPTRNVLMRLLQRRPGLLGFIVAMTRVPPAAMRS